MVRDRGLSQAERVRDIADASLPALVGSLGIAAAVVVCQIAGAIGGSELADTMFGAPVLRASTHHRGGTPVIVG